MSQRTGQMINQDKAEQALNYLAETDEKYAHAKTGVKSIEYRLKSQKAINYLECEGTVAERESEAMAMKSYQDLLDDHESLMLELEIMSAKRERARLTIDLFRTLEASRRQ